MRNILFALAFIALAVMSRPVFGTVLNFEANLDGAQVPTVSPGFGLADLTLDDSSGLVTITTGTYQDMIGASAAVTLNGMAAPGSNAPVLFALTLDTPGTMTGTFSGSGTLGVMGIGGMIAGNTYISIRSNVFPSGEIRGQILAAPEPVSVGLVAATAIGVLRRRR